MLGADDSDVTVGDALMVEAVDAIDMELAAEMSLALKATVVSLSWTAVPLAPRFRSGALKGDSVAGHCRTSPSREETTFQGHVLYGAPEKGGCRYTDISTGSGRVSVSVYLFEKSDRRNLFRRPRIGFATAFPPAAAPMGLATHVMMRVSATPLNMSHETTCRTFDDIPIAQLPDCLMTGPAAGSSTTPPSRRRNSYRTASQPPTLGFPSLASHL